MTSSGGLSGWLTVLCFCFYLASVLAVPSPTPATGVARLVQVNPVLQTFKVRNFGGGNVTLTPMVVCVKAVICVQLSTMTGFGALASTSNRLLPGAEVSLTFGSFPSAGSDVILFSDGANLNDASKILDAMAYRLPNEGFIAGAVSAGKWDDASLFVSGATPYTFTGSASQFGSAFWQAFSSQAPTATPSASPTVSPTPSPSTAAPSPAPTPLGVATIRRINCGGGNIVSQAQSIVDYDWEADAQFLASNAPVSITASLSQYTPVNLDAVTQDELTAEVARTQRQWQITGGASERRLYSLPLNHTNTTGEGRFEVRLFFLNLFDSAGSNAFDVFLQGNVVRTGVVLSAASTVRQVTIDGVDVLDGLLSVGVRSSSNNTIVVSLCAIEVIPTAFTIPWPTPAPVPVVSSAAPTPVPTPSGLAFQNALILSMDLSLSVLSHFRIPASSFRAGYSIGGDASVSIVISGVSSSKPREIAVVQLFRGAEELLSFEMTRENMLANRLYNLSPDSYADIGEVVLPFVLQVVLAFEVSLALNLQFSQVRVTQVTAPPSASSIFTQVAIIAGTEVAQSLRNQLFAPTGTLFAGNVTSFFLADTSQLSESPVVLCDLSSAAVEASKTSASACPVTVDRSSSSLFWIWVGVIIGAVVLLLAALFIWCRRRKSRLHSQAAQAKTKSNTDPQSSQWELSSLEKHTHGSGELTNESKVKRRPYTPRRGAQDIEFDGAQFPLEQQGATNGADSDADHALSEVNRAPPVTPRLNAPRNSLVISNTTDGLLPASDTPSPVSPQRLTPDKPSLVTTIPAESGGGAIHYNTATPNKTTTGYSADVNDTASVASRRSHTSTGSGFTVLTGVSASTATLAGAQASSSLDSLAVSPLDNESSDPAHDPSNWSSHVAPSGREYYHNKVTKETTWKRPLALTGGWQETQTPNGRVYYFNSTTGESSWVRPGLEDIAESARDGNDSDGGSKPISKSRRNRPPSGNRSKSSTALKVKSVTVGTTLPANTKVVKKKGSTKRVVKKTSSRPKIASSKTGSVRRKKNLTGSSSAASLDSYRTDSSWL